MGNLGQNIILIIALILLVILIIYTVKGSKTKKYKIILANDAVHEVSRNRWDALNDEKDMRCYHKEDGKLVWFSSHFTITKEEM
jgi:hypothetical protein